MTTPKNTKSRSKRSQEVLKTDPLTCVPIVPKLEIFGGTIDLDHFLRKDYRDIGDAAAEIPTIIEAINAEYQQTLELRAQKKMELRRAEGQAWVRYMKGGLKEELGIEKTTVEAVKAAISQDGTVSQLAYEFDVIDGYSKRLRGTINNLFSRLDLLRTFEATRRKLIEDGPEL